MIILEMISPSKCLIICSVGLVESIQTQNNWLIILRQTIIRTPCIRKYKMELNLRPNLRKLNAENFYLATWVAQCVTNSIVLALCTLAYYNEHLISVPNMLSIFALRIYWSAPSACIAANYFRTSIH